MMGGGMMQNRCFWAENEFLQSVMRVMPLQKRVLFGTKMQKIRKNSDLV
jgi:hypothetical protein